jgi:hypothetical protein
VSDSNQERPIELGVYAHPVDRGPVSAIEIAAVVLSVLWFIVVAVFFFLANQGGSTAGTTAGVMTFLAVVLPLALIWGAAITARTMRDLREEAARLQGTVDAMRHAYVQQAQAQSMARPALEKKLEEIAAAQRHTDALIATFTTRRDPTALLPAPARSATVVAPKTLPAEDEPPLALGTPAEALRPPISIREFVRAMNFPENADDKEGFRALRAALEDVTVAKLVRAAQDVLTLLAQDGIYMDDLTPARPRPELWRKFAHGERGRAISGLGGIHDRSSLALSSGRMRSDPVFRDTAHHFLRQFDRTFQDFEKNASDEEITELADTRSARAFMLFGRVTGIFD